MVSSFYECRINEDICITWLYSVMQYITRLAIQKVPPLKLLCLARIRDCYLMLQGGVDNMTKAVMPTLYSSKLLSALQELIKTWYQYRQLL